MAAGAIAALIASAGAGAQPSGAGDGLKVTLCGTSGPLPIRDRAKPCVAIQAGGALFLVDIGPEATENLQAWRMPIQEARAVFLTHLHSDHIGDLGEFNMQSWVAGRPKPLAVIGPPGVDEVVSGFNQVYDRDHAFRNAHHEHGEVKLPVDAGLLSATIVNLEQSQPTSKPVTQIVWSESGLVVTAIHVDHAPVTHAYAYRFDYAGRSVVVSGDTRKHPPLADAARGADVLIHEAQSAEMTNQMSAGLKMQGNNRLSAIMADTLGYHTTPVEAAEIAKAAGVQSLVLYHLTQAGLPIFTPEGFTRGMDAVFPDWKIAKDGMTIDLPGGTKDVKFGQR